VQDERDETSSSIAENEGELTGLTGLAQHFNFLTQEDRVFSPTDGHFKYVGETTTDKTNSIKADRRARRIASNKFSSG